MDRRRRLRHRVCPGDRHRRQRCCQHVRHVGRLRGTDAAPGVHRGVGRRDVRCSPPRCAFCLYVCLSVTLPTFRIPTDLARVWLLGFTVSEKLLGISYASKSKQGQ